MHNPSDVKVHLKHFVESLSWSGGKPSVKNRRYYPTQLTIRNHITDYLLRERHSPDDQENLSRLVQNWQAQYPDDKFFLRCKDSNNKFSFVHQTGGQRKLLQRYGSLCLLDATYKTSKYALYLFFLVVRTNEDYQIVATFITENEDSSSIAEALRMVREWNFNWSWKYFMTDYDTSEMLALEMVFPGK